MRVSFFFPRVRVSYVDSLCAKSAAWISFRGMPSERASSGRPYIVSSSFRRFIAIPSKNAALHLRARHTFHGSLCSRQRNRIQINNFVIDKITKKS